MPSDSPPARTRLLNAAIDRVRANGFGATSVDALCADAGVSKGSFFHHFASKEALGIAAAACWSDNANALFGTAPYRADPDPVARVLAYVDHRAALITGDPADFCCYAGTAVQEVHVSHPALRDACNASILGHADTLADDFAAALARCPVTGVSGTSLARHVQAVLQGGFIMAKAANDPGPALEAVAHLRRYLLFLFNQGEAA